MKLRLKPLREQVVVITGATRTARHAAREDARPSSAARNIEVLKRLTGELKA